MAAITAARTPLPSPMVLYAEGDDGAGIGDGQSSDGCIITITGGNIITAASNDGARTGAGSSGNNTIVNITGGIIAAASGDGAGIGAGSIQRWLRCNRF